MTSDANSIVDAVVIGGGFYGSVIAIYLKQKRRFRKVWLLEREDSLLAGASHNNQARVHNGYHYPRSFTTGYRSRVNLARFVSDWPEVVRADFTNIYAVARGSSKVTARQFQRFCSEIGAKLLPVHWSIRSLFDPRRIQDVFLAEEYVFDAVKLAQWVKDTLVTSQVAVRTGNAATSVHRSGDGLLRVLVNDNGADVSIPCRHVFNCTYSRLNQLSGDVPAMVAELKQEVAELALVEVPPALQKLGITVVDGPFFSMMPFPSRGPHTLSHVRYTPHFFWTDQKGLDPSQRLAAYDRASRVDRMLRDAARYVPSILGSRHVDSLFEVKTVLKKNEGDDGRPILFEKPPTMPGYYAVLGAKIDNVYDILEKLDAEPLDNVRAESQCLTL
jgi:glycine/D-amino acid oxidase-like deaminating enzyme